MGSSSLTEKLQPYHLNGNNSNNECNDVIETLQKQINLLVIQMTLREQETKQQNKLIMQLVEEIRKGNE
jgi:hypothetical protein